MVDAERLIGTVAVTVALSAWAVMSSVWPAVVTAAAEIKHNNLYYISINNRISIG